MKTNVVFLGCERVPVSSTDDTHWMQSLQSRGFSVSEVSWTENIEKFPKQGVCLLRTPWDYFDHLSEFLAKLQQIESRGLAVLNPVDVVQRNIDKAYLYEFSQSGIATVPSWCPGLDQQSLEQFLDHQSAEEYIVKPRVGAGGIGFQRLSPQQLKTWYQSEFDPDRPVFVQPVLKTIATTGETSLVFSMGRLTHAVRKLPKQGEIRIQEEWGGSTALYEPTEKETEFAQNVVERMASDLLYSRVDLVLTESGDPMLMELELIEPSLYFRARPDVVEIYSDALDQKLSDLN